MLAYKLFRVRKDGSIGALFMNRVATIEIDRWYEAEDHRRNGFAVRPGWHCLEMPRADHLKKEPKGEVREWFEVEIRDYNTFQRPESQGGVWYLAQGMRVVRQLSDLEICLINKQGSLACECTDAT